MDQLPLYNTPHPHGLFYEHKFYFIKGKVHKKGERLFLSFPIRTSAENMRFINNRYTYHLPAKEEAWRWMLDNQSQVHIYWWGPENKNEEKAENIIVKFRKYEPVRWEELMELLHQYSKPHNPPNVRMFAAQKRAEIYQIHKQPTFLDYVLNTINKWIKVNSDEEPTTTEPSKIDQLPRSF